MSVKVSSWAWQESPNEVKGNELLVLLALADIADDDGDCRFAKGEAAMQAGLSRKSRMSLSTFRRSLRSLEDRGLVEVARESRLTPNTYRVVTTGQIDSSTGQIERPVLTGRTGQSGRSDRSTVTALKEDVLDVLDVSIPATRGTRMTASWELSPAMRAWTREHAPSIDVEFELANFRDYWVSLPGQRGVKADWDATWRNNARRRHEQLVRSGWKPSAVVPEGEEWAFR